MAWKRWVLGPALLALVVLAGCNGTGAGSGEDVPSITARGVGMVSGVPDKVVITLGVETRSASAAEALSENTEQSNRVLNRLKGAGIDDEDIQTSQFSIHPFYDDEGRQIDGYTVTNLLTVRTGTDTDAGALIDAAAEVAGNNIRVQSVSFEIDDKGELFAAAREDAVSRAREQAEQLAEAAGVDLGKVRSIIESSTGSFPPLPFLPRTDVAANEALNFEPGTQQITLEVEVIYDISD